MRTGQTARLSFREYMNKKADIGSFTDTAETASNFNRRSSYYGGTFGIHFLYIHIHIQASKNSFILEWGVP